MLASYFFGIVVGGAWLIVIMVEVYLPCRFASVAETVVWGFVQYFDALDFIVLRPRSCFCVVNIAKTN